MRVLFAKHYGRNELATAWLVHDGEVNVSAKGELAGE